MFVNFVRLVPDRVNSKRGVSTNKKEPMLLIMDGIRRSG